MKNVLSTPAIPAGLPGIDLTDNSRKVLMKRYVMRGNDGQPAESVDEMFWRVAYHVAKVEENYGNDPLEWAGRYYRLMTSRSFFPNSPTFTGAGMEGGQLAACFVLPISDDMGRNGSGIFQTLRNAALIQQTGGGNGFSFSRLRPKNALVNSSAGEATGPVGFLRVYDRAFGEIAQGGKRRGANMAVLRVDHPDIEEFIACKSEEGSITNFNISVGITDAFMEAVLSNSDWDLIFPDVAHPLYREFDGTIEQAKAAGIPMKVYKTIKAKDLFDRIVKQSHHNGEPGLLFLDTANRSNPVPHLHQLEATNPCGEQFLSPYENCCLGSVNLATCFGDGSYVNWGKLRSDVEVATRFLDDVIDANQYVPAIPELKEAAQRARRIGLGIMGLSDLMYHCGIRYGSEEGQEFAAQVMEYVRYYTVMTGIELARERWAFPSISGSIYDPDNLQWQPPTPIKPYTRSFDRPDLDWDNLVCGIKRYGIRNSAQTTVAPTGTIATVAGCEGYGCEPVFALAYVRHVNDKGKELDLNYVSPLFERALDQANIKNRSKIMTTVLETGSCQGIADVPEKIRDVFVVAGDIPAEQHVMMQAAMQRFVDNSLSKTINFPAGATVEDVSNAYTLAWKTGCKGITVYVTGSREKVVLEVKAKPAIEPDARPVSLWHDTKKPRKKCLPGYTISVDTPLGKAFVTINENGGSQPFEVFVNTAKAGSETAAISESLGRLMSYILRLDSPIAPRDRLNEVVRQLSGIGGGRSLGFGPNRVLSLADGIAHALKDYIDQRNDNPPALTLESIPTPAQAPAPKPALKIGDLCPECGQAAVVNEEGCRKCYSCGRSEC